MVNYAVVYAFGHETDAHCVAFPVGEARGTRDCMAHALAAGLTVFEVDGNGRPTEVVFECHAPRGKVAR